MIKLRRSGSVALATAFAAVTLGYSFFQPFQEEAVRKAIPKGSTFVFKVNNLNELLQSPVCNQLDKALSNENVLEDLLSGNQWTGLAASSEIAVADIPFRNHNNQKTWAAASWVGWRSPWLRWKLEHTVNPKLKLLGKHAVWPIWQYDAPDLTNDRFLTFSLTDNLFLICLSDNPTDIFVLLDTYDGQSPSVAHFK